jgi:hypothetical protein
MLGVAAKSLSGAEASQLLKQFLALDKVGLGQSPLAQTRPLLPLAARLRRP